MVSISVVSSMDTRSTQSKVSLRGNPSSTLQTRSRMTPDMFCRLAGATMGLTTLRCSSWRGGSIEMNDERRNFIGRSVIEMPPSLTSEEKISGCVSTAMMSLNLVTDQKEPY